MDLASIAGALRADAIIQQATWPGPGRTPRSSPPTHTSLSMWPQLARRARADPSCTRPFVRAGLPMHQSVCRAPAFPSSATFAQHQPTQPTRPEPAQSFGTTWRIFRGTSPWAIPPTRRPRQPNAPFRPCYAPSPFLSRDSVCLRASSNDFGVETH